MARAPRVCTVPGCPALTTQGRCTEHERMADRARGTAAERGYKGKGHRGFRTVVLQREPICSECRLKPSTVADHYPLSRRELIERELDPNDPAHGRGLCAVCHNRSTAEHQPGGWASS